MLLLYYKAERVDEEKSKWNGVKLFESRYDSSWMNFETLNTCKQRNPNVIKRTAIDGAIFI